MSSTNKTTHYELPQYVENDIFNPLVDDNDAYEKIDTALYQIANAQAETAGEIVSLKNRVTGAESDIDALELQNGNAVLTTDAQTLSGAVNELNAGEQAMDARVDIVEDSINNPSTGLSVKVSALERQNGNSNLTTDAQTLSGAINEVDEHTNANTSDIASLVGISPKAEYASYITVGKTGVYQTITEAYNKALEYADANNKVAIIIFGGRYHEQITNIDTHYIDFYGVGDVIWDYDDAYPNSPLFIGGDIEVHNITFRAYQPSSGSPTYAIHIEGASAGYMKFVDCSFTSFAGIGFGIGFCENRTVEFINCEFVSWTSIPLYVHNRGDADANNQALIMNGCRFTTLAANTPAFAAEDARYRGGTTATVTNSILNITAYNCISENDFVRYQEVTDGAISYELPFIPKAGDPYYKQVVLKDGSFNGLTGLTSGAYRFKVGASGMFDPSCNFVIPYKDAEKFNVTAFVQLGGYGGSDISSDITVTVSEGKVLLHSSNSAHAANQFYAELTFILA